MHCYLHVRCKTLKCPGKLNLYHSELPLEGGKFTFVDLPDEWFPVKVIHTGQDRKLTLWTRGLIAQFMGARVDFVCCEHFVNGAHGPHSLAQPRPSHTMKIDN
jgi:hypothetical protein